MDWISEIAAEIPVESLPQDLQLLAEMLGTEKVLRISERFGGMGIYIPKIERLVRLHRDRKIRHEFTGSNHREIANKYNITETWVREILKKGNVTARKE